MGSGVKMRDLVRNNHRLCALFVDSTPTQAVSQSNLNLSKSQTWRESSKNFFPARHKHIEMKPGLYRT